MLISIIGAFLHICFEGERHEKAEKILIPKVPDPAHYAPEG
jgi:hypothetical protein